jgi:hypothetical protein
MFMLACIFIEVYASVMENSRETDSNLALWNRVEEQALRVFSEDLGIDWISVGNSSLMIVGTGNDNEYPKTPEDVMAHESHAGERLAFFGRPVEIGLDGQMPIFS